MKRFLSLVAIIMVVTLTGCQSIESEKYEIVTGCVSAMQYVEADTSMTMVFNAGTKMPMPIYEEHPAQYLVTITYECISETFDSKELYERVKEGESIQMLLYKACDKEGNLIKQTLQIADTTEKE